MIMIGNDNDRYLWYVEFVNVYKSLAIQKWNKDVDKQNLFIIC